MEKKDIEQLYINATYNDESPSSFASKILELNGEDEQKQTRSSAQSKARWKYLTMIASILNDKGFTFDVAGLDIPIKFTKDILYNVYWLEMKRTLYPEKKRQLNTSEFSILVDHVMDLFAMIFDIHLAFPNYENYMMQKG